MDPVKIADEGVSQFKKKNFDLIVVDTSGRHKQESSLFDEMKQVSEITKPDDHIFVMDSHIGSACYDQALAFKSAVDVGSVIITKLESHAKGGGALAAVAATESPITFIGTGEHFEDFESFDPQSFIKKLLGMGDLKGLFEKVKDAVSIDNQKKLVENISKGIFSLRDMKEQYQAVLKMGPLDKVVGMIPGLSSEMMPKGQEKEATKKINKFLYMMDSMTDAELDCKVKIDESRIRRIARGSGTIPQEVKLLIDEHGKFAKMVDKMKGLKNKNFNDTRNSGQLAGQLQNMIPQNMLSQLGGAGNLMNMVKEMGGMQGLQNMAKEMGMGGLGGKTVRKSKK
jgi:signal recognition particle subunit SRP54